MEGSFFGGGNAKTLPQQICEFLKNEKMSMDDKRKLTACFNKYYQKKKGKSSDFCRLYESCVGSTSRIIYHIAYYKEKYKKGLLGLMENTPYVTQIRNVLDHYRDNPGEEAVNEIKYNGWDNVLKLEKCFYCYCESEKQKKNNFVKYFTATCKSSINTLRKNIEECIKKKQRQENIEKDFVTGLLDSLIYATEIHNKYESEYRNQRGNFHTENFHDANDANGIGSLKADAGDRAGNESTIYRRALGLILEIANKNKNLTYRQLDPHVLGALIEVGAVNVSDKENLKTGINPKWYKTAKPILEQMYKIQQLIMAKSASNEYCKQITAEQIKVWLDVNKKLGVNKKSIESIEGMLQGGVNNGMILCQITNHWMYFPRLRRWVGNYLKEHLTNLDEQTFVKESLTYVAKIIEDIKIINTGKNAQYSRPHSIDKRA